MSVYQTLVQTMANAVIKSMDMSVTVRMDTWGQGVRKVKMVVIKQEFYFEVSWYTWAIEAM